MPSGLKHMRRAMGMVALAAIVAASVATGPHAQALDHPRFEAGVPLPNMRPERPPGIGEPLLARQVLDASARHFPKILAGLAKRNVAAGKVLEADGAFDTVFSANTRNYLTGFYDGQIIGSKVEQPLRTFGGSVYGSYRKSEGDFPTYEDVNFTNDVGEFKIGAFFSLLRNRSIDARRFGLTDSRLALQQADFELMLTQIGVQYQALTAYLTWVANGRQYQIYENLLQIAQERQVGLEEQVRRGARARIFLTENLQNILRRRRLYTEAQRDYLAAANDLAFYYRSAGGTPVTADETQLPPPDALEPLAGMMVNLTAPITSFLQDRPELQILRTSLTRARNEVALRENDLRPNLDFSAEIAHDVGRVQEGGISRDSTDTIVGLRFSVPLQRRQARGKLAQVEARIEALDQERRQLEDQLEIELRNVLLDLVVSQRLVGIAQQEVEQALTMQRAEQQRFDSGASDFFLVNLREERTADARIQLLLAELKTRLARANFDAGTVNTQRLRVLKAPPVELAN